MFSRNVFFFIVLLFSISTVAQTIKGLVIDEDTKLAVPYAAIQINSYNGTITNDEGYFSIDLSDHAPDVLIISSMGYEQLSLPVSGLTGELNTIRLTPAAIVLNEVLLQNKMPTAEDIIRRVTKALPINYDSSLLRYQMFYRETSYMELENLDLTINKATGVTKKQVGKASEQLDSLTNSIITSKMIEFKDYSGDILLKNKDSAKIAIQKATKLVDSKKDFSIEKIQERAQNIILQYLDTTLTYKLKTGLFKIEDSLSLDQDESEKERTNEFSMDNINSGVIGSLKRGQFYEEAFLSKILNPDLYRYSFVDASFLDGSYIYVVSFRPRKAKSKFSGTLYISANDYAILKADYAYSKGKEGTKVNFKLLLGIKYIENINKGTIIFRRNTQG
ncbi:MAG: carboxypeptidase-like regulatory domain-containing protein, partial [Eudoraea sp.]|nr:carboxypeptidase-like regulatory domain-containing protein [Eudoraea sp.]